MIIKKLLIVALIMLSAFAADAQVSAPGGYDWRDSSVVPPARMQQHFEFMNNQYNFPAQPRSQWELGIKLGAPSVSGDVDASFPGFGFGLHARKALGYVLSIRGEYTYGNARGVGPTHIAVRPTFNAAWEGRYPNGNFYYNYKTSVHEFSLQGVVNLNNISFHRAEPKVLLHAIFGAGFLLYDTKVDATNAAGANYAFAPGMSKATVRGLLDGTYETNATTSGSRLKPTTTFGLGASFKVSNKVNVSLENRLVMTTDDLMDGVKYYYATPQGSNAAAPIVSNRNDLYNFLSFGVNINLF